MVVEVSVCRSANFAKELRGCEGTPQVSVPGLGQGFGDLALLRLSG